MYSSLEVSGVNVALLVGEQLVLVLALGVGPGDEVGDGVGLGAVDRGDADLRATGETRIGVSPRCYEQQVDDVRPRGTGRAASPRGTGRAAGPCGTGRAAGRSPPARDGAQAHAPDAPMPHSRGMSLHWSRVRMTKGCRPCASAKQVFPMPEAPLRSTQPLTKGSGL
jgi:hypothetical protein